MIRFLHSILARLTRRQFPDYAWTLDDSKELAHFLRTPIGLKLGIVLTRLIILRNQEAVAKGSMTSCGIAVGYDMAVRDILHNLSGVTPQTDTSADDQEPDPLDRFRP